MEHSVKLKLNRTDELAMERTRLANERTFLAYFRTAVVFLSSGVAIMKIKALQEITDIGYFFIGLAPIILIIGILRYFSVLKKLKKF